MMNGFEEALTSGVEGGTIILFPALGELIGERAGIVNLGTEGCMLSGALAAYAVGATTGSAWLGVIAAIRTIATPVITSALPAIEKVRASTR